MEQLLHYVWKHKMLPLNELQTTDGRVVEILNTGLHNSGIGRADMVVQTRDYVYIMEFKMDQTADAALQQIDEKGYALPFAADPRRVFKIGVSFNSEKRRVDEWKMG